MPDRTYYEVSLRSVVKVIVVLVFTWLLFITRGALAIIFVSFIFASALTPWVDRMQRRGVHRGVSVLLIYILLFAVATAIVMLLIPPITEQFAEIGAALPSFVDRAVTRLNTLEVLSARYGLADNIKSSLASLTSNIGNVTGSALHWVGNAVSGIFSAIIVFSLIFYFIVGMPEVKKFVRSLLPDHLQPYSTQMINRIQSKLGRWLGGQLLLGLIIGTLTYIGLKLMGVEYALVLAIIAGFMELIPYIGPILSAVPAVFIALVQSPILALYVVFLFTGIQLAENQIIVPRVMSKTVGLNPIVVIGALLIGGEMAGVLGMILAVPMATILTIIVSDLIGFRDGDRPQPEEV